MGTGGKTEVSTQPADARARGSRADSDALMFRDLMERYAVLAETNSRFSQEVYRRTGSPPEADLAEAIDASLAMVRTVFDLPFLEILVVIYLKRVVDLREFQEILGRNTETLTTQLGMLEALEMVQREFALDAPGRNRYSLTHKGLIVGRLGEPLILYLRLAHGWSKSSWDEPLVPERPI